MSYTGLIEINIICIAVLLITLLQFKESVLRHLEERILGFTIIDTIIYIVLSTVTKMLYMIHVQSDLYGGNKKICVVYAVMYALSLISSLLLGQLWFSFIFLRIRKSIYSYKHLFPLFSTPSIIGIFICIGISIYGFTNDCHATTLQFRRLLPFLIGLNMLYIIDAINYFEKYLEAAPTAKNANAITFTVAALYQTAGNKAKALENYKKVLTDPQFGANAKQMVDALNK